MGYEKVPMLAEIADLQGTFLGFIRCFAKIRRQTGRRGLLLLWMKIR